MQEQEASRDTACLPAAVKQFDRQNAFKATRNKCKVFEEIALEVRWLQLRAWVVRMPQDKTAEGTRSEGIIS
jgi:hypothetical protein